MKHTIRTFEVVPDVPAPAPQSDRFVEADTIDAALAKAAKLFAEERRDVRALSCLASGGLVAYVFPPRPEPEPRKHPRDRRRRPPGRH